MIVNIDIGQIGVTAKKTKNCLTNNKKDIQKITTKIQESKEYWEGEDRNSFERMWNEQSKEILKMNDVIENYASFLEYSEKQYSNLQSRLKNKARLLPK